MADLSFEQRRKLRRLAEDAISACNRHYGPFADAVAHPLNILALLDMADRSANQLAELPEMWRDKSVRLSALAERAAAVKAMAGELRRCADALDLTESVLRDADGGKH